MFLGPEVSTFSHLFSEDAAPISCSLQPSSPRPHRHPPTEIDSQTVNHPKQRLNILENPPVLV